MTEKESQLKHLENLARDDNESEEEEEFSPFARPWQRVKIPNLDLSEDESSGVSSTDLSVENFIHGYSRPPQSHQPPPPSATLTDLAPAASNNDQLSKALHKINSELARVLNYIDKDGKCLKEYTFLKFEIENIVHVTMSQISSKVFLQTCS